MNYNHPDNRDLKYVDWRKKENRIEGFFRWLEWRLRWSDVDHYTINNAYRDYAKMSKEQEYWYCTIFGTTYQSEMAWVIFSQFPNFAELDIDEVSDWNDKNYKRQAYARDTKYNKGRIAEQFGSIKEVVGDQTLTEYYESVLVPDLHQSYQNIFDQASKFKKFGRMTSWLLAQTLHETAGIPAIPDTCLATDPSSWSVRSGLFYLFGEDELIEAKNKHLKLDANNILLAGRYEKDLIKMSEERINGNFPEMTNYLLESHLCQYKKLMLGGDYSGHSSGDHIRSANKLSILWPEVDFKPFYDAVEESYYPDIRKIPENRSLRYLTSTTGQMIHMEKQFPDMPCMYKELGLTTNDLLSTDNKSLSIVDRKIKKYNLPENSLERFF